MIRLGPGVAVALTLAVIAAGGLGLARFAGHHHDRGVAAERERNRIATEAANAKLRDVAEQSAARAAEILVLEQERAEMARRLDEEAQNAPSADRDGIDSDGWMRIEQSWR